MFRIFKYFSKIEWLMLAIMTVLIITQSYIELEIPGYIRKIINLVVPKANPITGEIILLKSTRQLWINGGIMLALSAISITLLIFAGYISAHLGARIGRTLRQKIFYKVQSFSLEEMGNFSVPSLITRNTNDVQQVSMAISMGLRFMIKSPVTAVIAIIKSKGLSSDLTLVTASAVFILAMLAVVVMLVVVPKFKQIQKLIDKINGITRENLTGLRVIRAYNAENYQQEKFEIANKDLTKKQIFVNRVMSLLEPAITLVMNGMTLAITWLGAYLLSLGRLSDIGVISAFSMYAMQIIISFLFIIMIFVMIPRASVAARRINEVLDTPVKIKEGPGAESKTPGTVEFKNVCFKYPNAQEYVLKDISFFADSGQTIAFIGSTGSGKSTLIKLIPRFFDATKGSVLIGGVDVRQYTKKQLNKILGYVPQKGVLFSGDIKSNIVFGDTVASDQEMQMAAQIANAEEFIQEKSEKYDSSIAQGGTNVSGGQRQRLTIARALVRKPDILIFDDSFSALDFKTDKEIREKLKENIDSTVLIVAQRIGTIINADKIIVLDNGEIVGMGTHQELMQSCKVYQEIAYSQLSKEELA